MKGDMTRGSATKQILLFTLPFFIGARWQCRRAFAFLALLSPPFAFVLFDLNLKIII